MEVQEIIKYIDEPFNMKEEAFSEIKELREKYPFFHTANLLFAKAAHNLQDELYASEIEKVSASIPDREILHTLINLKEVIVVEKKEKKKESRTMSAIRGKIKKRRVKRVEDKGITFLEDGKKTHSLLLKNFFEPIFEHLYKEPTAR